VILISNLVLNIKDGSTIASTNIYGADKKTYINIGSGNVFKLEWGTPALANDNIDRYSLVIKRYDPTLNVYYNIFDKNIGLVNEFFVDSPMLPVLPEQYMLSVYLVAYGKQGSVVTSNVINPYVSKGSGTYVKVEAGYAQSIMKRALAFANAPTTNETVAVLMDSNGEELVAADDEPLTVEFTRLLSSATWNVMQEGYTKDAEGNWRANDIEYEVLVDSSGNIITDENGESIYVL
jgi:hypothetical protein